MDWKKRFKNPIFWILILITNIGVMLTNADLKPEDITNWNILFNLFKSTLTSPIALFSCITTTIGVIINPTTKGIKD